jgi:hypothetical protein
MALALMPVVILVAQVSQSFNYQAIARDETGNILSNWDISILVSIVQGDQERNVVYTETHQVKSNAYGLINLNVGKGIPQQAGDGEKANFADIDWGKDRYYIRIEIDFEGGGDYKDMGTMQLYAVPYALYAEEAGKIAGNSDNIPISKANNRPPTAKSHVKNRNGSPNSKFLADGDSWLNANTGNVGIGTATPEVKLDVRGSGTDDGIVFSIANSDNSHKLVLFPGRENDPNPFVFWKAGDPLRFTTDEGGWSEKMRITSDGKVGIGTVNPITGLHVKGNEWPKSFLTLQSDEEKDAGIRMYEGETVKWHIFNDNSLTQSKLRIAPEGDYASGGITIVQDGDVGIGINDPLARLHVDGVDGVLFTGSFGTGSIPAEGEGTRLMWYPAKAAFRAGKVTGVNWDIDSIGDCSFAYGSDPRATGNYSTAIGQNSRARGHNSIALGFQAFAYGGASTAIGYSPTASGDHGSTAVGSWVVASGDYGSSAFGHFTIASGWYGATALGNFTTASGTSSIAIGDYATAQSTNSIVMGKGVDDLNRLINNVGNSFMVGFNSTIPTLFVSAGGSVGTIGKVGIGTVSPTHILHVTGVARSTDEHWTTTADSRVIQNINKIEESLAIIEQLRPISFNYTDEYIGNNQDMIGVQRGFIAQEVKYLLPEMVTTCTESFAGKTIEDFHLLNTSDLTPILVAAVQEQQEMIENQNMQIAQQQEKIENQQNQIELLWEKIRKMEARLGN